MTPTRKPQRKRAGKPMPMCIPINGKINLVSMEAVTMTAKDCRRLAKWLEAAARYLDEKGEK